MDFVHLIQKRRSIYALNKKLPLSKQELVEKIGAVVKDTPSAFNAQSARVVVLFEKEHEKLWRIVLNALKSHVSPENFEKTAQKISTFSAGFGTVLFFEDTPTTAALKADYPLYAQNFETWAEQGNAMLQFAIWEMLAELNIGSSLQHYNPLIDAAVLHTWNLPQTWRLIAQMPFGGISAPAAPKTYLPLEERLKIFE